MKATLYRYANSPDGVFGFLVVQDDAGKELLRLPTLEDDWLDNKPSVSCIPAGTYTCRLSKWHSHGDVDVFEITKVPGRERILIHYGNTEEDVKGCIILGTDRGSVRVKDEDLPGNPVRDKWAVINSREAFKKFMALMHEVKSFPLTILWDLDGQWRK